MHTLTLNLVLHCAPSNRSMATSAELIQIIFAMAALESIIAVLLFLKFHLTQF